MLVLNLPEGSLGVALNRQAAADLREQLERLKQCWQQPVPPPRPELNWSYTDTVYLEFFCNPNLWPSPFAAQVLVTVRHPQVQVSTQIGLPQLLEDVALFQNPI